MVNPKGKAILEHFIPSLPNSFTPDGDNDDGMSAMYEAMERELPLRAKGIFSGGKIITQKQLDEVLSKQ